MKPLPPQPPPPALPALDTVTGNEHDIALHAHRIIHVRDEKVEKDERIK